MTLVENVLSTFIDSPDLLLQIGTKTLLNFHSEGKVQCVDG